MFSNNVSSSNVGNLQRPSINLLEGLVNNTKVYAEDTDLINLHDDFSNSPTTGNEKTTKIDDLQIKELEKFLSNTGTATLQNSSFTIEQQKEYQMFFDKCERKTKEYMHASRLEKRVNEAGSSTSFMNQSYTEPPKVLIAKIDQECIEDLIDEVLLEKTLLKQRLQSPMKQQNFNNEVTNSGSANYASPSSIIKSYRNEKSDIMDQILSNNIIPFATLNVEYKDDYHNLTNNNNVLFTKKEIPNQHLNPKIKELVSKYNITYLKAIKMDDKIFQKQSVLKTEAEKTLLTPGPTLNDKSVVLPQIMNRLIKKKKNLDEYANLARKLVLDTGSSDSKTVEYNASLGFNASGITYGHAKTANFQSRVTPAANLHSMAMSDKIYNSSSVTSKIQTPMASGSKNNQSMAAKNDDIGRNSRFIHIDQLKALRKEKMLADPIRFGGKVLKPPEILMADCNKARFVAHATSQIMHDFVNGK